MKNLKLMILMLAFGFFVQANYAQSADVFIKRAQAAQSAGLYDVMVRNADAAVKLDSNNALGYFLRGVGYYMQNKDAEAVADSAKALELDPKEAHVYFLHAGALIDLRPADWKIVLADLDKAIEIDSTYWEYFRERARIRTEYAKDYANALIDANQSIKLNASDASAFYVRGSVNQELKDWAAAESDYSTAISMGKNSAKVYDRRGIVYFLQNKRELAVADFRAALALEPDDRQAKENLELALSKPAAADSGKQVASTPPRNAPAPSAPTYSMDFPLAFANDNYEKVMPAAEEIFKKLTTHRYPAPKEVSYMGKTTIVDPFGEDKNKLAVRLNSLLQAQRSVLDDRNAAALTPEQRQLCQDRLDKIIALQMEAARRHLVTLEQQ